MNATDHPQSEQPVVIPCIDRELSGVLHRGNDAATTGVVLIVGGPQYRIGSHRQFVMLARALARGGVPVLRFDYRGLGDSGGALCDFEQVDDDIRAALEHAAAVLPVVRRWVLWGLCDAASAASFYVVDDPRVSGLVLLNPWVRTDAGAAKTTLKHYYLDRIRQPEFWRKLARFDWNPFDSIRSVAGLVKRSRGRSATSAPASQWRKLPLPERMRYGLERFDGPVLLVLSGRDLTAREFEDAVATSPAWQDWLDQPTVTVRRIFESDHTFSRREWSAEVERFTLDWLKGL